MSMNNEKTIVLINWMQKCMVEEYVRMQQIIPKSYVQFIFSSRTKKRETLRELDRIHSRMTVFNEIQMKISELIKEEVDHVRA